MNILKEHKSGANVSSQNVSKPQSNCNSLCIQVHDKLINTHGKNICNWDHLIPAVENIKGTIALYPYAYGATPYMLPISGWKGSELKRPGISLAPSPTVNTAKQF